MCLITIELRRSYDEKLVPIDYASIVHSFSSFSVAVRPFILCHWRLGCSSIFIKSSNFSTHHPFANPHSPHTSHILSHFSIKFSFQNQFFIFVKIFFSKIIFFKNFSQYFFDQNNFFHFENKFCLHNDIISSLNVERKVFLFFFCEEKIFLVEL